MFNKKADIPYCGCDKEKIKNANPVLDEEKLDLYVRYQKERTNIYYKKEVLKEPAPWTKWDVLQKYKFTNTRRELDRESKILIENVLLRDDVSDKNKLLNSIFLRVFYSKCYPILLLKERYIDFDKTLIDKEYKEKISSTLPKSVGDPAYLLSTISIKTFAENKGYKCVDNTITFLEKRQHLIYDMFFNISSPLEIFEKAQKYNINPHGKFIFYQVFVDMTYIPEYKFSENEFTLSGPGCTAGIRLLCKDKDCLSDEEFMFWLRDNIEKIRPDFNPKEMFHFLPEDQRNWGVMQIENSFCEFSKLCKSKNQHRRLFKPKNEDIGEW